MVELIFPSRQNFLPFQYQVPLNFPSGVLASRVPLLFIFKDVFPHALVHCLLAINFWKVAKSFTCLASWATADVTKPKKSASAMARCFMWSSYRINLIRILRDPSLVSA